MKIFKYLFTGRSISLYPVYYFFIFSKYDFRESIRNRKSKKGLVFHQNLCVWIDYTHDNCGNIFRI